MYWKQNEPHRSSFSELADSERCADLMHNTACFWKPFGIERVNESKKLLKSAEKYVSPPFS